MVSETKEIYEFGPFRLDVGQHRFERSDGITNGALPEKVFQTLVCLVRNQGRLVTKNELLDAVWPDTAVEENNVNKSIHAIRHALEQKPRDQKYIETVHKHGYRFVAEVRRVEVAPIFLPDTKASDSQTTSEFTNDEHATVALTDRRTVVDRLEGLEQPFLPVSNVHSRRNDDELEVDLQAARVQSVPLLKKSKRRHLRIAIAGVLISFIGLGGWFAKGSLGRTESPILSAPFNAEKLSTDGKVPHAVISPDGRFVVYMHGGVEDRQSVWLRNLETGHNTEIIAAGDDLYFGFAFSPDGDSFYFVRRARGPESRTAAYRMPITGGIPVKVVSEPEGWISISPDGRQIAFVRCNYTDDNFCSLWVADSLDGQNEKMRFVRPRPFRIRDVDFSPDGRLVAFSTGQSENMGTDFALMAVDVKSGPHLELSPEKFFNIAGVAWLPDQQALLVTASKAQTANARIWYIDVESGEARPLTKDTDWYRDLSLNASASTLISTNIAEKFPIRVMSLDDGKERFTVPDGTSIKFASDGRLFYRSSISGSHEIWSVDTDGTGRKQLTVPPGEHGYPVIAQDGNAIYFASNRSGSVHVWRMSADGSNPAQITKEVGGFPLFASPDGEWVYYHHEINRSLWRVSVRTGVEQIAVEKKKNCFAVSPEGSRVAFPESIGTENFIFVVDLATGERVDALKLTDSEGTIVEIAWLPDASGVAYIVSRDNYRKHTLWLHKFDARNAPGKIAEFGQEIGSRGLAISPDGKNIAVSNGGWLHDAVLLKGLK